MSDEKKLPPCDPEVFENGESAGLYDGFEKEDVERLCKSLSQITGWRIDWSYFAGRPHIRALPPAEQHQGEPVAWRYQTHTDGLWYLSSSEHNARMFENSEKGSCVEPLYTHGDAGEVERLRSDISGLRQHKTDYMESAEQTRKAFVSLLAERDALLRKVRAYVVSQDRITAEIDAALSASAEPSAPKSFIACRVDETCGEGVSKPKCDTCKGLGHVPDGEITGVGGVEFENGPVERVKDRPDCKPSTLTDERSAYVLHREREHELRTRINRLQADLTARDQRIDQLEQVVEKVFISLRGSLEAHGLLAEVKALLLIDLHSRPEERGQPEKEPCSGCGVPGWTANCDKCIPF